MVTVNGAAADVMGAQPVIMTMEQFNQLEQLVANNHARPQELAEATTRQATVAFRPAELILLTVHPSTNRPYRAPLAKRKIIDEQIDEMLQAGVTQPISSPWASLVTLVPN